MLHATRLTHRIAFDLAKGLVTSRHFTRHGPSVLGPVTLLHDNAGHCAVSCERLVAAVEQPMQFHGANKPVE
jgi:hypothetical protein